MEDPAGDKSSEGWRNVILFCSSWIIELSPPDICGSSQEDVQSPALSGLPSSGIFVNGILSSGGLHFAVEDKGNFLKGYLAKDSHKATLWATWPLNGMTLHSARFPQSYSDSNSVAVALFQHPSSCPLSAWMLGGKKTWKEATALQLPHQDTRCWVLVS